MSLILQSSGKVVTDLMEQDDDNHLCLRCGQTIIGLNNYVSHRQQGCFKINQPVSSPLLSQGSDILTSVDSSVKELQEPSFTTSEIYKLSADDFFLSLNLQSIANTGSTNQRALSNVNDNFCSKLGFTTLDNDLDTTFTYDKEILPEQIISDTSCMNIDRLLLSSDKLESVFKTSNNAFSIDENVLCDVNDVSNSKSNCEIGIIPSSTLTCGKDNNFETDKQDATSSSAIVLSFKQRASKRQANSMSSNIECCTLDENQLFCSLCNFKSDFISTFLNHLLLCEYKESNEEKWLKEVFRNELHFIKNVLFTCNLCSFYSNDRITFLEHLKNKIHCQKEAKLKNPLICLPCRDVYFSSDDMISHFSKNHLSSEEFLHPIIVIEKKRNIHCCHCLALVKACILSVSNNNNNSINNTDLVMSTKLRVVIHCGYGIKRGLSHSHFKLFKSLCRQKKLTKSVDNLFINYTDENIEEQEVDSVDSVKNGFLKKFSYLNTKKKSVNAKKFRPKVKVYFCFKCKTEYKNTVLFKNHLKLHKKKDSVKASDTKKTYLCEICGYVCKTFHGMTKHKRYHTGEKPFNCPYCDLSFAVSNSLLRHKRTHTGLKPYSCPYCSYVCNNQENLRKHILKTKKHAGRKMYPCKTCNFECNEFSDYRSHMLKDHSQVCSNFKNVHLSTESKLNQVS